MATVVVAVAGCYLMAFYAKRPFAIAPYMGENAFVAFTVCKVLGFPWQTSLAAIFLAGTAFVALTILRLRQWIARVCLRLTALQFQRGNRVLSHLHRAEPDRTRCTGGDGGPGQAGHLTSHPALVAIFGFVLIAIWSFADFREQFS